MRLQSTFSVYRYYDKSGLLLYVGRTRDPFKRFHEHHADACRWIANIARMDIERFATYEESEIAEILAIKNEKPLHNKVIYVKHKKDKSYRNLNNQKFLNLKEAAEYLGISRNHFYRVRKKYELRPMGQEAHMPLYALKQLSDVKRKLNRLRVLYGRKEPIT